MIDTSIETSVDQIVQNIDHINFLIAELHTKNVEIRVLYKEPSKGDPAKLEIFRAVEHVNYLKKHTDI